MKKHKILILILTLIFILISVGMLTYNLFFLKDVMTLNMQLETADIMGLNTDSDALYFGKNYPGGTSLRMINITNDYNYPVFVSIKVEGEIAQFVTVSDNDFYLGPTERKTIRYYVETKEDTPYQEFTGITRIVISRSFFNKGKP